MGNTAARPDNRVGVPGAILSRLRATAIRSLQTVVFAATFVLLTGVVGAFVLKPIVALVVACWEFAWPR